MAKNEFKPPQEKIPQGDSVEYSGEVFDVTYIDECNRLIYTNNKGQNFYFEHGEHGTYPVTIIPSFIQMNKTRNPVGFPSGYAIGNGCFKRGGIIN